MLNPPRTPTRGLWLAASLLSAACAADRTPSSVEADRGALRATDRPSDTNRDHGTDVDDEDRRDDDAWRRGRRKGLVPTLDCVDELPNQQLRAHWGYRNDNDKAVRRKLGQHNHFEPEPADRGQPTKFLRGRQSDVFTTTWSRAERATWVLERSRAVADETSPRCVPGPAAGGGGMAGGAGTTAGSGGVGGAAAGSGGQLSQAGASGSAGQPSDPGGNYVILESQPGDPIGDGHNYVYTDRVAVLDVSAANGGVVVGVMGDESWRGEFHADVGSTRLSVGHYADLERGVTPAGSLDWWGNGRGCSTVKGSFDVDTVMYSGETLTALDLRFEQRCDDATAALRGRIRYRASDHVLPNPPLQPPPAGLWEPPPGSTPASGRYVYLSSEPGDPIGHGRTLLYTQANASLLLSSSGATHLTVRVLGDSDWNGVFESMLGLDRLVPGYYGELERSVTINPALAGLGWSGEGRGCEQANSWFMIDEIAYAGDAVESVSLRFKQQCLDGSAPMYGKLRWTAQDSTMPPGPQAVPADLWKPADGATPASPRYLYLESSPGDPVGAGRSYVYTQADAVLTLESVGGYVGLRVTGDDVWRGELTAQDGAGRLLPGYYANLGAYPTHNPTEGGLSWAGNSTSCGALGGWFAVDAVTYTGDALAALDVRFEQRCAAASGALRGRLHWEAQDATVPPGPRNPPPVGLWKPAADQLPVTGSYVLLHSDPADTVGEGRTLTLTLDPATVHNGNQPSGAAYLSVQVDGWDGGFATMLNHARFEPGYYGGLKRLLTMNPARGGLEWTMPGHLCNDLQGWFVVDAVTYDAETVRAIDLRFEQHCEGAAPALHGYIHLTP